LGRRREKTDRSGATNRDIPFKFLLVLTRCLEGANRKSTPSRALARLLLVQRHLRESGEIWLCLFLPVPSWLLSSPSTNQGQFHL
jgi:hypothetical protein